MTLALLLSNIVLLACLIWNHICYLSMRSQRNVYRSEMNKFFRLYEDSVKINREVRAECVKIQEYLRKRREEVQ